jgi:hypothetical protein
VISYLSLSSAARIAETTTQLRRMVANHANIWKRVCVPPSPPSLGLFESSFAARYAYARSNTVAASTSSDGWDSPLTYDDPSSAPWTGSSFGSNHSSSSSHHQQAAVQNPYVLENFPTDHSMIESHRRWTIAIHVALRRFAHPPPGVFATVPSRPPPPLQCGFCYMTLTSAQAHMYFMSACTECVNTLLWDHDEVITQFKLSPKARDMLPHILVRTLPNNTTASNTSTNNSNGIASSLLLQPSPTPTASPPSPRRGRASSSSISSLCSSPVMDNRSSPVPMSTPTNDNCNTNSSSMEGTRFYSAWDIQALKMKVAARFNGQSSSTTGASLPITLSSTPSSFSSTSSSSNGNGNVTTGAGVGSRGPRLQPSTLTLLTPATLPSFTSIASYTNTNGSNANVNGSIHNGNGTSISPPIGGAESPLPFSDLSITSNPFILMTRGRPVVITPTTPTRNLKRFRDQAQTTTTTTTSVGPASPSPSPSLHSSAPGTGARQALSLSLSPPRLSSLGANQSLSTTAIGPASLVRPTARASPAIVRARRSHASNRNGHAHANGHDDDKKEGGHGNAIDTSLYKTTAFGRDRERNNRYGGGGGDEENKESKGERLYGKENAPPSLISISGPLAAVSSSTINGSNHDDEGDDDMIRMKRRRPASSTLSTTSTISNTTNNNNGFLHSGSSNNGNGTSLGSFGSSLTVPSAATASLWSSPLVIASPPRHTSVVGGGGIPSPSTSGLGFTLRPLSFPSL